MKSLTYTYLLMFVLLIIGCSSDSSSNDIDVIIPNGMYFPPIGTNEWESVTPKQLGWDITKEQALYNYLEDKNTKGFLILKNGRIIVEKYFNGHNNSIDWPWYSAAKGLTATFVGIAQDEGFIDINNKTSDYLSDSWSVLSQEKQALITVKHHLSMTTGLTPHLGEFDPWVCKLPICLDYTADAGENWAYHQAAYMLLQDMVTENTGMSFEEYCKIKVADKIGMDGNWTTNIGLNIYNSNTRSMARFGLLMLNRGEWKESTIVSTSYFEQMINTSQEINTSYGYLWWLNGKENFIGTTSTASISGSLIPNAPDDMFAALGANDQKIYIIPSQNIVIVRSGESAGEMQLGPSSFDNELWSKINAVIN